jgi:outer membrane protein
MADVVAGGKTSKSARRAVVAAAMAAAALASSAAWAQASGAAAAAGGAKLTIDQAMSRAIGASAQVRQAELDRDAQLEKRRGAWSDVGPRVTADYNYVHYDKAQTSQFGPTEITTRPEVIKSGALTIAQPITGAFALVSYAQFQGVQESMKDLTVQQTRMDVVFGAAESYLRAQAAQRQLQIAQDSIRAAEKQARDAGALERVGRMNHGDVLRLQLAVSEAKAKAAQARAGLEIALAGLKEAIGAPQAEPLTLDEGMASVVEPQLLPLDQAVDAAFARRIDDDQAELGVESARFGKKLAYAGFSPTLNVFVKQERNFGELLGADRDTRSYGVQFSWTIWENGSKVFATRAASADIQRAETGRDALKQAVRLELAQVFANLAAAHESLALAESAVQQAEEAYRIENARFQTGTRSATDLILAEAANSGAQGRLVGARTDLGVWGLRLQKALGDERPKLGAAVALPTGTAPEAKP